MKPIAFKAMLLSNIVLLTVTTALIVTHNYFICCIISTLFAIIFGALLTSVYAKKVYSQPSFSARPTGEKPRDIPPVRDNSVVAFNREQALKNLENAKEESERRRKEAERRIELRKNEAEVRRRQAEKDREEKLSKVKSMGHGDPSKNPNHPLNRLKNIQNGKNN